MKKLTFNILVLIQLGALLFTACGRKGPVPPPDKTPPSVTATSPLNGTLDFPVTGTIMITFSKVMDPSSINESTVVVTSDIGTPVAGSFTTTGAVSVFTPSQHLNEHTRYKVMVSTGVKDSYGIASTSDTIFYFTTLSFPPPKIVDIQPASRAKNVGPNTAISILFSEPIDPNSITGTNSNNIKVSNIAGDFYGTVSYNEALDAVTFYPSIKFNSNTNYIVTVATGVTDLGNTPMTDAFVSSFQTGAANDLIAPTVQSTIPNNTAINIDVNTPISVTFSEPMDLVTITPSNFIVSQGTSSIPGDIKNYGNTIVFTPTNPLAYSTLYTAAIITGATDLAGNPLGNYSWSFTTGSQSPDSIQPSLLATWPTSSQNNVPGYNQVVALFSESMLASSITPTTFVLVDQNDPNQVPVPGQVKTNGAAAIFIPSQNLAYNTTYKATIISATTPTTTLGVTDLAGNPLGNGNSPAGYTWNFTTEAPASFTITATTGPNGSISPAGSVTVNINNSQTFTIMPNAGFHINDVLVDGTSVGAVSSYTFNGVTDYHTISASFAINTFTITTSVVTSGTGTITPVNPSVTYGASQPFTITPATGNHIVDVVVDGASKGPVTSYQFTNVTASHTVSASFAINTYTVTGTSSGNGTITPTPQSINYGTTATFTVSPSLNYHIVSVTGCGGTLSGTTYTTGPITAPCTASATFSINTNTITTSVVTSGTGTITPVNPTVNYGANQSFTITPATGYHITDVQVDGGSVGAVPNYMFNNVTAAHTISGICSINTFTITASAGPGGSITPSGSVIVNYGATQTFSFTPNTGYFVSAITVDGFPVPLANSYTFTNVTLNHTILVSFANNMYQIGVTPGAGGTITPGTTLVPYGGNQTFTIQANTGYHLVNVVVDTVSIGAQSSYTFTNVTSNHTLSASFAINTYTVTPSAGANGSISPNTAQTVNYNGVTSFTLTPTTGYHLVTPVGGTCGGTMAADGITYTTAPVTGNCMVQASFAINTYTVTPSAGANGSISPNTAQTVNYNGTTSFTLTPTTAGYHLVTPVGGTCGGTLAGDGITYTTAAITGNCTVQASFAINTYTINFASGGNGTLSGTTSQTVNYGGSTSAVTAVPSPGYSFVNWTGDNGFVTTAANPLTVTNVTASQNITASFAINTYTVTPSAGANGSISPNTAQTVNYNGTTSFTLTPTTAGYHLVTPVGGTCGGTLAGDGITYTTAAITGNCTVQASFAINTFTITAKAGPHGSINPVGNVSVNYGADLTFMITAQKNHTIADVVVDGSSVGVVASYPFTNVTANHTITASFL